MTSARLPRIITIGALAVPAAAALAYAGHGAASADGWEEIAVLSAGDNHTCAVTAAGALKCWGDNTFAQIGDGTLGGRRTEPVGVAGLNEGVAQVVAGGFHTCALTDAGGVKCWGDGMFYELGTEPPEECPDPLFPSTFPCSTTPVDVDGLASGAVALGGGSHHTCAVLTGGGVKCWGWNPLGQLGDGTTESGVSPVDVVGLSAGVVSVEGGSQHTCAVTEGGGVECWGRNSAGQLGAETDEFCDAPFLGTPVPCSTTPVAVTGLGSRVVAVTAAANHTCALTDAGGVKCWGSNGSGQLGDGTGASGPTPVDAAGLQSGAVAIAAGRFHTCAVTAAGGVKCWGDNFTGRLGDGTTEDRATPVDVCETYDEAAGRCAEALSGATAVAAGSRHSCAVTAGGGLSCWGDNSSGQFGNGTSDFDDHPLARAVPGFGPKPPPTPTPSATLTPGATTTATMIAPTATAALTSTPTPTRDGQPEPVEGPATATPTSTPFAAALPVTGGAGPSGGGGHYHMAYLVPALGLAALTAAAALRRRLREEASL